MLRITGFTIVVCGLLILALRWEAPKEEVRGALLVPSAKESVGQLAIRGGVSSAKVESPESIILWISFHNQSSAAIKNLRVIDFQAPGFVETGGCWRQHAPGCRDTAPAALPAVVPPGGVAGLPPQLAPGAFVTIAAALASQAGSGRYSAVGVFAWDDPVAGEMRNAILLGPLEITTWWREWVVNVTRRLHTLLVTLALPVVLVYAGYWFQKLEKEREERRKMEERDREERRQKEHAALEEQKRQEADRRKKEEDRTAERRAQRHVILTTLLRGNLRDTQKYYLPICVRLGRLETMAPRARTGGPRNVRLNFHALMLFLRQIKLMQDQIGGHHFQNRLGEEVATAAWAVFYHHLEQQMPFEDRTSALKQIGVGEDFQTFSSRLAGLSARVGDPDSPAAAAGTGPLVRTGEAFARWVIVADYPYERCVSPLEILHQVFLFEINRPFEYWYGAREQFPADRLESARGRLPDEPVDKLETLKRRLDRYVQEGQAWEKKAEASE